MPAFEPSYEIQKVIRSRLLASPELMALVSGDNILDATGRPERIPCVNIGQGQTVFRRFDATSYADLHIWNQELGLTGCKAIASAMIAALLVDAQVNGTLRLDNFICHDMRVTGTRYLRDPHGSYSHGIVTTAAIVKPI